MRKPIWAALLAAGLWLPPHNGRAAPFEDGDVVCFLGDSITAGGGYQTIISNYYLTRFPERRIRFVNAGRAGDTAGGSLQRLQEDVIDQNPNVVAIMFGMNDVNRRAYVADPGPEETEAQHGALLRFKENLAAVVARLRAGLGQPKLLFLTPTPFDETVVLAKDNNRPGCNDGLARCAEIVRELAAGSRGLLVDFHGPMTALNLGQQQKDPAWTIIGGDRVHPGAPGQLMQAWLFLKTQGAPAVVSKVAVDATAGRALESVNAEVSAIAAAGGGVTFTVLEKSLPFPIDPAAATVLDVLPIEKDLNQQILSVQGLAEGDYELKIDGFPVGRYCARDLRRGINLAFNEKTPQFKQAQTVAKFNESRRNAEARAVRLLNTRRGLQSQHKINPDDLDAVRAHCEGFADKKDPAAVMALDYINKWPKYDELRQEAATKAKEALAHRTPAPHEYAIQPAR
jgi:lysophospholipase L1-like esterase